MIRQLSAALLALVAFPTVGHAATGPLVPAAPLVPSVTDLDGRTALLAGSDRLVAVARGPRSTADDVFPGVVDLYDRPAAGWPATLAERRPDTTLTIPDSAGGSAQSPNAIAARDGVVAVTAGRDVLVWQRGAAGWSGPVTLARPANADVLAFAGSALVAGPGVAPGRSRRGGPVTVWEPGPTGFGEGQPATTVLPDRPVSTLPPTGAVGARGALIVLTAGNLGTVIVYERPATGWAALDPTAPAATATVGGLVGDPVVADEAIVVPSIDRRAPGVDVDAYVLPRPAGGWAGELAVTRTVSAARTDGLTPGVQSAAATDGRRVLVARQFSGDDGPVRRPVAVDRQDPGWFLEPLTVGLAALPPNIAAGLAQVDDRTIATIDEPPFEIGRVLTARLLVSLEPELRLTPAAPDGGEGWYRTPPTAAVATSPAPAGARVRCAIDAPVPSPSAATLPDGCSLSPSGTLADGVRVVEVAAQDALGQASGVLRRTVRVDATAPAVACPAGTPEFAVGSAGIVRGTAGDTGSGIAESAVEAPADTRGPGERTVVLTARDVAGNATSVTCGYRVTTVRGASTACTTPPRVLLGVTRPTRRTVRYTIAAGTSLGGLPAAVHRGLERLGSTTLDAAGNATVTIARPGAGLRGADRARVSGQRSDAVPPTAPLRLTGATVQGTEIVVQGSIGRALARRARTVRLRVRTPGCGGVLLRSTGRAAADGTVTLRAPLPVTGSAVEVRLSARNAAGRVVASLPRVVTR
ncbi:hypothetical protein [Conexibacter sp. W3-3-2]|uniref:hypothetical protein n=1 Tax=Conexibacter sp. W3-3-2 TaxID=2675227 RepID=UPI0018A936F2|nr:hypothetical protein [Conexibacter sp. W3-3-2]